ncbi:hypothetical protein CJ030_MR5G016189 [Morella rubra]|uniref:Uncharacterized protein n=1 Tax=Morella rubra TaxID=262757 RepID=A0A6A1VP38_9ROSI|nr:hypothetical protein CJ030_MR5G016189 [Morella rubra]
MELQILWSPPPSSSVKINFDVACRPCFSVIATLCRDHEGNLLQVWTRVIPVVQALWGDIKAALLACHLAENYDGLTIFLEGDSLVACSAIHQNAKDLEGYLVADCKACHAALSLHPLWSLSWIPRQQN